MMILKKKEVIAASLVVLIGLAGYLNWSYRDTVRVKDGDSYIEAGKILGEAEPVSSNNEADEDAEDETDAEERTDGTEGTAYFEDARLNRESARAAAMEALKEASEDETVDEETRRLAGERLVECAENIELESSAENIAAAKGFGDVCVYINDGTAVVTVKTAGLSDEDAARLADAVNSATQIPASAIKLVPVG